MARVRALPIEDWWPIAGAVLAGLVLLVAVGPASPLHSGTGTFAVVFVLPLAVALLAYRQFAPAGAWWEYAALAAWGLLVCFVAAFVAFLGTMDTASGPLGTGLVLDVVLFGAVTAGIGVPYGVAGALRRTRPVLAAASVLLAPALLYGLFAALSVVV